ncbi:MAG: hypothetical protein EOP34_10215, partial [Rickettsiales bacterium]
ALIWAALGGHTEIAKLLIAKGADVNIASRDGNTALTWPAYYGYKEIVDLLIKAGADVNVVNKGGYTALISAASRGHTEIGELLIKAGADVNVVDKDGYTALIWAASRGHTEIVDLFIKAGADVNVVNKDGYRALNYALRLNNSDLRNILIAAGAKGKITDFIENIVPPTTKGTFIGLSSVAKNNIPSIWNVLEDSTVVKTASNLFCKSTSVLSSITPSSVTNYLSNKSISNNICAQSFVRSSFVMAFLITASAFIYNLCRNKEQNLKDNICKASSIAASSFVQSLPSMGGSLLGATLCGGVVAPVILSVCAGVFAKKTGSYLYDYVKELNRSGSDTNQQTQQK